MVNTNNNLVFGLDIGTRSVVGTVGIKLSEKDFIVEAMSVKEHDTRAMIDGQIHDIYMVTRTISDVKRELEDKIGGKLDKVCIAAAGRVLKTQTVITDIEFPVEKVVTDEDVYALEMAGVEDAYKKLLDEINSKDLRFYCVGYSAVKYFVNGYSISKLQGHRANKISVELLATFLPEEVIEGLYSAVEGAGLTVENLTLEPIAAINVAIPEKFRLLNIALVDVGAGTSDICITKEGSVTAYGMIPFAGDELTEAIAHKYLVEFNEAERIKVESTKKKQISFTDIMGMKSKLTAEQIQQDLEPEFSKIAEKIAEKIIALNGDKTVSAVFVVGGGGKYPGFVEALAKALNIPKERVALRGEEVLTNVIFRETGIKKDPLIVTPVGICLNYYENKNSFVQVKANGSNIKIFDNNNLNIADVALAIGIKNEELFPKNGKKLTFTYNGVEKSVRGDSGEPAKIMLNGKSAFITSKIKNKDEVEIIPSTIGEDAHTTVGKIAGFKEFNDVTIDGNVIKVPTMVMVNGSFVSSAYDVKENDNIETKQTYTLSEICELTGVEFGFEYTRNGEKITPETIINSGDVLDKVVIQPEISYAPSVEPEPEDVYEDVYEDTKVNTKVDTVVDTPFVKVAESVKKETKVSSDIFVVVNGNVVRMHGKDKYIFVDVLDFYNFDTSVLGGSRLVLKVNELPADFTTPVKDGDIIDIFWER